MELSQLFLAHAGAAAPRLAAEPGLEELLRRLLEAGRDTWPDVGLAPAAFMRHLAERLPEEDDPAGALAALPAGDLYLACACGQGNERALQLFERDFISQISIYLGRADTLSGLADEVKQLVRMRLLVAEGEAGPRIGGYRGRGSLGGWLRIVAARAALEIRRARDKAPAAGPDLIGGILDPELSYLKSQHAGELEAALRGALAALPPREGTVLRLHFLDGVPVESIAGLYGTSARTIQRWIAQARERILDQVRRSLAARLHLTSGQLEELLGLLSSRIDITLQTLLGPKGP